jgi:iron complex outermembrane receptor protein
LGSKWNLGTGATFDLSVFYNRYKDLISFQQLSKPLEPLLYEVVNLKQAVMQGFEVSFSRVWENKARASIGYTFLDARDVSADRLNDDLAYKVKHTLSASATVYLGDFLFNANGRYRSGIKEVFIYPGNEPAAAYVLNAKVAWQIATGRRFYLAIDNMTNTQYEELERYRMPGRSYTAGAEFSF